MKLEQEKLKTAIEAQENVIANFKFTPTKTNYSYTFQNQKRS